MHQRNRIIFLFILALTIGQTALGQGQTKKITKPLKVYLLAGQSNMQGKAQPFTIASMAKDPVSKELYHKMTDEEGAPRVHDDVSIVYFTMGDTKGGTYRPLETTAGKLSVGYGAPMGPELAFGITMDEVNDEPILIIKTAWGGKSLFKSFRPPSAGVRPVEWTSNEWEQKVAEWKELGIYEQQVAALQKQMEEQNAGQYYQLMVKLMKEVLANPGEYCAAYDPQLGYELAGFVWFQGFNDMIGPYPQAKHKSQRDYAEYSRLLSCFIRDVRKEFSAPELPFVIGVMGIDGDNNHPFCEAMRAPAKQPEFEGNVVAVDTAPYWDHSLNEAKAKAKRWNQYRDRAFYSWAWDRSTDLGADAITLDDSAQQGWAPLGVLKPEEREWRYTTFNLEPYHTFDPENSPLLTDPETWPKKTRAEYRDPRELFEIVPAESRAANSLAGWYQPDYKDSEWKTGPAPIGFGKWRRGLKQVRDKTGKPLPPRDVYAPARTEWDGRSRLLMRTSFEIEHLDYGAYRLHVLSSNKHSVYLNGHKIRHYIWSNKHPVYRVTDLDEQDAKHLKIGTNTLAIYATPGASEDAVDAFIDAISKEDKAQMDAKKEEIFPALYEDAMGGISNAAYHYMGSAKIYSRIGEAMAEALIELE